MSRFGIFPECPNCYSEMNQEEVTLDWVCPVCGERMDEEDFDPYEDSDMPGCCIACGGPYPDCIESCKIMEN